MSEVRSLGLNREETDVRAFMSTVYLWMAAALVVTAVVAAAVANDTRFVLSLFSSGLFWVFAIGELVLVVVLGAAIQRLSAPVATMIFVGYSALNGVTLSIIFLVYTDASIATTFLVTAGTFGLMSIYGFTTRRDLTTWRNLLVMGLIGFVIASIVNLFLRSDALYWILTYAGILVFVGLTAYDTQKLKRMAESGLASGEMVQKLSILGALTLYLDFINLFLLLLRLMGRRR
jgi:FtsH-binding integral membrane protein